MKPHSQDEMMIKLEDWFDHYNPEHMKAYQVFCDSGCWPEKFIPKHVYTGYMATMNINAKIAQAWLHAVKHGQIIGGAHF